MGVEAEFQACAKNLDESIKREMMRKGAMATNTLRNIEIEYCRKAVLERNTNGFRIDHPHREKHQHHSLESYVRTGMIKL